MTADGRKPIYTSGQWEVDLDRRELRASSVIVQLGGRAFDIIEVLVQAAGNLVTKDELIAAVWPGSFVEDNTVQVHISALRKALGSDRDLLRTASGRGYRLLGNWTVRPPADAATADTTRPPVNPMQTGHSARGNIHPTLPVPGSNLVGRAAAVRHLHDLLSAYRVVTLAGPGGIGKTRLALEVAHGAVAAFQDGICFVELASLVDPELVPSAVTATLGLELRGNVSPEAVARAIGTRKLLLALDNCEHVIDAAARLAEAVVRVCPRVTVLATSREELKIDGEYVYRMLPLDIPPDASTDLLDYSAVQLFLARAQALNVNVSPHGAGRLQAVAAICRRLDGIPLAIEFAAARAATLGLEQVLSRLDDRFGLLTGGRRTAMPRHQTLRATLDWSYELLPETERRLLARLAIFAGSFTLEAATAVTAAGATPWSAVDGIVSLVSKSLVSLDGSGQSSRWRLLETTRAYALEKLNESNEADVAARLHAQFYRRIIAPGDLAANPAPAIGPVAVDLREIDNIRAALDWAFSPRGDAEIAVALTIGAVPLWVRLSLMDECRERVETALERLAKDIPDVPRARMQLHAARGWSLMFAVGRARETGAAWTATLQLAESLGDTGYRLRALWGLWVDDLNNGRFLKAAALANDFAGIVSDSTEIIDRMMADRMLATSFHFLGDQRQARRHIELMLGHYEMPALDPQILRFQFDQRVTAHYFQARILWLQGFADQATRVVASNIEEARTVANALSLGSVLGQGACPIALFTGDIVAAANYGAILLDHAERHALNLWQAWARAFNAIVMVRQGNIAAGLRILRAELTQVGQTRFLPRYLILIGGLADALLQAGEPAFGLETVDEALKRCEANDEGWYVPELFRIRGELILRLGGPDAAADAELDFVRSLDRAEQQGALSWTLRTAVSLARHHRDQGRAEQARAHLSSVYGRFTEGFGTADLQAAKQLLTELA